MKLQKLILNHSLWLVRPKAQLASAALMRLKICCGIFSRNLAYITLVAACLIFSDSAFGTSHESRAGKEAFVPLTNPIPQKIKKGDIVVAAVEHFRLPRSKDAIAVGATTTAYARLQYLMPVGDGSGRLAICDLRGTLYLTDKNGESAQLYLDHRKYDIAFDASMMPNETGLGGFAFHPEFSKEDRPGYGKFYTAFSAISGSGEADYLKDDARSHESVIVEWTTTDPNAVPFHGTYREVFRIGQFAPNHSVGTLAFKPTAKPKTPDYGILYFCLGDGGAAFDPKDYGQSLQSPHAAILRINPMPAKGAAYQIPKDNPFVSRSDVAPEIWAYGLRHPQHFSWDETGRMFIGDIGQNQVEEVNVGLPGANYGWRIREGTFSTGSGVEGATVGPVYDIPADDSQTFTDPVAQYDHDEGRAIGSGFAYQGTKIKALMGKYVFADIVRGRIFYIDTKNLEPGNPAEIQELRLVIDGKEQDFIDVAGYPNTYREGLRADLRLGMDEDGELYLLTKGDGWVRKLVPANSAK